MNCPKCNAESGDDWSQCKGACPMLGSPHYRGYSIFDHAQHGQTATVGAAHSKLPSVEEMVAAFEAAETRLAEIANSTAVELAQWMKRQGFDPDDSWLVLPESQRGQLPQWPDFVLFSAHIDSPALMKRQSLSSGTQWPR